ncbi:MAG: GldG family protein [Clostridiales bacterium]|nr:GldG family protein [Clostridiales bacterium]
MEKFVNSFKNKKFRYGGYATAITAVALAILIIINLLVGKLNLKVDLTKNKLFSLSEQTYNVLDKLNKNVTIYVFDEAGKENETIKEIADKYAARSKKIDVQFKDPIKYPQFANKYASNGNSVNVDSIVVESGSKFKLINSTDLVNYSYDQSGQPQADSLAIEQRITGAITYVTSNENSVIQVLQGHEETSLPDEVTGQLENQNYTIKNINLLTKDAKLDPKATLVIASPKRDLSTDETTAIRSFLSNGGRAIFLMDIVKEDMPNFASVLGSYGVGLDKVVVVEGDSNYIASNPIYLLPKMESHDIVNPLKSANVAVLIPGAQAIKTLNVKKSSITIEPILTTSSNSWGKKNLEATTSDKEAGDSTGPFNIAVAITDKSDDTAKGDTKLVVVSNGIFLNSQFINATRGGNTDLMTNSLNWLQDKEDTISVSPKSLDTTALNMSQLSRLVYSGITVIIIPAVIIIWGVTVWLRRKRA